MTDWKQVEVSCQCGLTIEFYHFPGFSFVLEHDDAEPTDSLYWGSHMLHGSDAIGNEIPFHVYLSYIAPLLAIKEPVRA